MSEFGDCDKSFFKVKFQSNFWRQKAARQAAVETACRVFEQTECGPARGFRAGKYTRFNV